MPSRPTSCRAPRPCSTPRTASPPGRIGPTTTSPTPKGFPYASSATWLFRHGLANRGLSRRHEQHRVEATSGQMISGCRGLLSDSSPRRRRSSSTARAARTDGNLRGCPRLARVRSSQLPRRHQMTPSSRVSTPCSTRNRSRRPNRMRAFGAPTVRARRFTSAFRRRRGSRHRRRGNRSGRRRRRGYPHRPRHLRAAWRH
jgi:hypothetical protein